MSPSAHSMNPQLVTLLEIQDLRGKIRELEGAS